MALSAPVPVDCGQLAAIRKLYAASRWSEIVRLARSCPAHSAETDYYEGMALAKLERWSDAQKVFQSGAKKCRRDKRFPIELAGIAFRRHNLRLAEKELSRAVRLDPRDSYATNFLATIYFLDDNLPAALKYWNRLDQPKIANLEVDPKPHTDPALLDRAFVFSPANVLRLSEFWTTEARLDALGVFPHYRFELAPRDGRAFDVLFHPLERNGWGDGRLDGLLSLLRGAPYQTVYPQWFNIRRSALNFTSLARWDSQKRRLGAVLSGPLHQNPRWRWSLYADGREEKWDVTSTFHGSLSPASDLGLERLAAGGGIKSVVSGSWSWQTGAEISIRRFPNLTLPPGSVASPFFTSGLVLKDVSAVDYKLLSLPERHFTLTAAGTVQLGRLFVSSESSFDKLQGSLLAQWNPQIGGHKYQTSTRMRAGKTFGEPPFDELFMLGLERDNDLWLRAHNGTRRGRKGAAPLGRNYVLLSWDGSRAVYHSSFAELSFGPFLDSGEISDPSGVFGARPWLWDTGAQLKLHILGGPTVEVWYGRDLRSGRASHYATSLP
jgi:hypothetical protein